ncbi:S1 family peptidase, partial [Nocardia sp. NPDC005746]|uniref:S1 family peptidase n=1 Tax=Nocardia sp. NPDC005746 TaxID=3157062 RepID=UPI0034082238
KVTIKVSFTGLDDVAGPTTTQQITVANGTTTPTTTKPNTPPPANAVMGGDVYGAVDASGEAYMCSLGFNGTDASGHTVNITAGHCDPNDPAAAGTPDASTAHTVVGNAPGDRFGTFAKTVKGPLDHAVIKIDDNSAKRFQNNYVRVPGKAPLAITGVATPMVGQPVCFSGSITGYHCGKVKSTDAAAANYGDVNRGKTTSSICALSGDSGGVLVTGTMALGIASQNNGMRDQQMCDEFNADPAISDFDKPTLITTPIVSILKNNPGLKVRTN